MFSLLLSDGIEGQVLEPFHLGLQKLEIDRGDAAVVLPLDVFHAWARDAEDRHPSAIDSANHHLLDLSSPDQPKSSEEEVIGLEHVSPPFRCRMSMDLKRRDGLQWRRSRGTYSPLL
jgi:hypothetical protein